MNFKILIVGSGLILVLVLIIFGGGLKEKAINGMVNGLSEYNCEEGGLCTSCTINDTLCSCGDYVCACGDMTVNKTKCELF